MKGMSHPRNDIALSPAGSNHICDIIERVNVDRRALLRSAVSSAALASVGGLTLGGLLSTVHAAPIPAGFDFPGIGFESIPAETRARNVAVHGGSDTAVLDRVSVPAGYKAELFVAWGDPIMPAAAPFIGDASETAAQQARQFGMHNDGMHFFPLPENGGRLSSERGVLCVNNEYTHEDILTPNGQELGANYTIHKTRKSQNAHGVSILEARRMGGKWTVVKNSPYGRRITANTPCRISGPAAGHALMRAKAYDISDTATTPTGGVTDGRSCFGTVNNCAHGITPWGTYLTCEENWNGNFSSDLPVDQSINTEIGKLNRRYGVSSGGFGVYNWHKNDERFDPAKNPNEPHLFGWVVEVDPFAPDSKPIKRTALGRFKHESAQYVVDAANNVAFYMGDDERNEYIYKFVCARKFNPGNQAANRDLLDSGTLYVARFDANLQGRWIALAPGTIGLDGKALRDNPNFSGADDAEVLAKILIKTRLAADAVGATQMDRPEWTGARPRIFGHDEIEIYCTLTNNNRRSGGDTSFPLQTSSNSPDGSTLAGSARPPFDAANPRPDNDFGHIIRWRENGKRVTATTFSWNIFVQCGDSRTTKTLAATYVPNLDFGTGTANYVGNVVDVPAGSADFGAPDGLWFDYFGRLWVQTDQVGDGSGDFINIGANCMVCADPNTGKVRRFLTGPNRCEVTGVTMTPDGKTMFVGVQHPGEDSSAANPTQFSNWPQNQWAVESDGVTPLPKGRPRSAVVVITKNDDGIIGS
ncbi:PhoX family protein [Methylocystis echinoides]|uniref:Tat pathway signal protein n=1 Tax=Methylocystis echinoides TaxID=29468 RepID=A0A9W6LUA2_9HYPH|nr:PhoX family phosphatase [Methylocystis echinoides]GLI95347.1 Tat pathway signal protein [Methylocystis echinoides]